VPAVASLAGTRPSAHRPSRRRYPRALPADAGLEPAPKEFHGTPTTRAAAPRLAASTPRSSSCARARHPVLLHGISKLPAAQRVVAMPGKAGLPRVLAYGVYLGEIVAPILLIDRHLDAPRRRC
jgi:hypothetical protein